MRADAGSVEVQQDGARDTEGKLAAWDARLKEMKDVQAPFRVRLLDRARRTYGLKTVLLQKTQWAFGLSAVVMSVCFVGLASTPWLGASSWRGAIAAVPVILGGVVCLAWYGRIAGTALK